LVTRWSVLRTALLFVRSAVRLVYAELPGPVAVLLLKQAAASWVIVSLGRNRIVEHRRVQRAPPPHRSLSHPATVYQARPKANLGASTDSHDRVPTDRVD
jgi:hypothetical protein